MDTPERNQIGTTSISKFEDSPVFNYINSLSPIQPVKSTHITQSFNPLSFAALPSVFTSPHVSSHKESRFLRRHNYSDPSKPEVSSENESKVCSNEGVAMDVSQIYEDSSVQPENFDLGISVRNATDEQPSEHSKSIINEPQSLNCYSGCPNHDQKHEYGIQVDNVSEFVHTSKLIVPYVPEGSENGSSEAKETLHPMSHTEPKREGTGYGWESAMDAADLLIFSSPNGSEAIRLIQKPLEPFTGIFTSTIPQFVQNDSYNMQTMEMADPVDSAEQCETEKEPSQSGEAPEENGQRLDNLTYSSNADEEMDNEMASYLPVSKPVSNLHRGMRRRCLDFETAGTHTKNLDVSSNRGSSVSRSDDKSAPNNKQLVLFKSPGNSSRCILNGIGLHLNALATTSKDPKNVSHENFPSGKQRSFPSSTALFSSPTTDQEPLLNSASSEIETEPYADGSQPDEDAPLVSAYVGEDQNQSSPRKKRSRLEHSGESDACKRCNCKKSKCLKLYCECFAAGVYCIEPCSCQECFNKPIHEDTVLATRKQIESRNPLAFAPKVIRSSDSVPEVGDESSKTPASARHKRGCNCKKSSCLKKYCECYQGGVGCSISCRCEGCKNAFGRKDGSALVEAETEQEEESEASQKSVVDKSLQATTEIQNKEEQNSGSALPSTPLLLCRPLVQLPFSSRTKLARSSFFNVGSSSGWYTGKKLEKPNILRLQPNFEKHTKTVPDDEIPEILRTNSSPNTTVKTTSPNSKRVSPPQSDFGSSPLPRTGRKLILQSIPSFPSLTPQH